MTGPREELLNRYGVQVVVMNTMDYVSGALYPLALALANPVSTEWELVYDDSQAVVFQRRPPPGTRVLSNKLGRVLRHLDRECSTYIENAPDSPLCARTLGDYWMRNQAWEAARRMYQLCRTHAKYRDEGVERALQSLDSAPAAIGRWGERSLTVAAPFYISPAQRNHKSRDRQGAFFISPTQRNHQGRDRQGAFFISPAQRNHQSRDRQGAFFISPAQRNHQSRDRQERSL